MNTFAKVLLAFGIMLSLLSIMLNTWNDVGSPESMVGWLNVGLGITMVLIASAYLAFQKKKRIGHLNEEKNQSPIITERKS